MEILCSTPGGAAPWAVRLIASACVDLLCGVRGTDVGCDGVRETVLRICKN
jgi:hypothetical protein